MEEENEYIGTIKLFAGNFAPVGYALCNGAVLPIATYEALYTVLGTIYGGDGERTFRLPNLSGRIPVGAHHYLPVGVMGGSGQVQLTSIHLPPHTHTAHLSVNGEKATKSVPTAGDSIAIPGKLRDTAFSGTLGFNTQAPDVIMNRNSVTTGVAGSNTPINQLQPYLCLNYIICTSGVYPPRDY